MSFNGSGVYTPPASDFPAVTGTTISSTKYNNVLNDVATGLSTAICKDGQTTVTANIPMATYKFTGLGNGSAATDSAALGQVQGQAVNWCATAGGTADALTLTPSPAITAVAAGQVFRFKAASTNTTACTLAISGLSTIAIQSNGSALVANQITANHWYEVVVDASATSCQLSKIGVIKSSEVLLDDGTARASIATVSQIQSNAVKFAAGAGTADAITATYSPVPRLVDGMEFYVRASGANTVTTPTFNPIGLASAVTITIASPGVVTQTAHGRYADDPVVFTTSGALPTGLTAGTVYYILAPTTDTYTVAATPGGAAINTSGTQSGTHTGTVGAHTIYKNGAQALVAGDIYGAGHEIKLRYRQSPARYELVNPAQTATSFASAAEIKTGTEAAKTIAPDKLLSALGFSARYTSGNQTITAAGSLTLAHSLGREPIMVTVKLVCQTGEGGYTAGDKAIVVNDGQGGAYGCSIVVDSTNLNIRFASSAQVFVIINKTSGAAFSITPANWKVVFDAYA